MKEIFTLSLAIIGAATFLIGEKIRRILSRKKEYSEPRILLVSDELFHQEIKEYIKKYK